MSDVAITANPRPVRTPLNRPKRAVRLPQQLQTALKAIIWDGQALDEAAAIAGLTTHTVRCALAKPHIITWMKAEREVLRAYVSAQNIHRAREIRDAADNMPAMHAIKYIDGIGDEQQSRSNGLTASAGVTIRIVNVTAPGQQMPVISGDILNQNATNET